MKTTAKARQPDCYHTFVPAGGRMASTYRQHLYIVVVFIVVEWDPPESTGPSCSGPSSSAGPSRQSSSSSPACACGCCCCWWWCCIDGGSCHPSGISLSSARREVFPSFGRARLLSSSASSSGCASSSSWNDLDVAVAVLRCGAGVRGELDDLLGLGCGPASRRGCSGTRIARARL